MAAIVPEQFALLPRDLQCEILSYPIDLDALLALRAESPELRRLTSQCVTNISPKDPDDKRRIKPDLVYQFPKLQVCGYPIIISRVTEMLEIAKLERLTNASFFISKRIRDTTEYYDKKKYPSIKHLTSTFFPGGKKRYYYGTEFPRLCAYFLTLKSPRPESFSYEWAGEKYESPWMGEPPIDPGRVLVWENGIYSTAGKADFFFTQIKPKLEVADYTGTYNPLILSSFKDIVTYRIVNIVDNLYGREEKLDDAIVNILDRLPLLENLSVLVPSQLVGIKYSTVIQNFYVRLFVRLERKVYPNIRVGFPIYPTYVDIFKEVFPNVETIVIMADDNQGPRKVDWNQLEEYPEIVLVWPEEGVTLLGTTIGNPVIIPDEFTDRVTVIPFGSKEEFLL